MGAYITRTNGTGGGGAFNFASGWSGSGTFADGNVVSITRAAGGLSIPTDPRPSFYCALESAVTKDATYSRATSPAFTLQTNATFQSGVKPTNSTGALDQLFLSANGTQPGSAGPTDPDTNFFTSAGGTAPGFTVTGGKAYIAMKRYRSYDSQTSAINGKNLRIWAAAPAGGVSNIYIAEGFIYSTNLEGTSVPIDVLKGGANPEYAPYPHPTSSWFRDEWIYKESSSNTINGYFDICRNGNWAFGSTNRQWNTRPLDADVAKTVGFFSQYSSNGVPPNNAHEYMQDLYVNLGSVLRVFVSTESSYRNSNNGATDPGVIRELQLPIQNTGSANGLQILLRKMSYASLSGLYMYIVDDTETAFQVGQFA